MRSMRGAVVQRGRTLASRSSDAVRPYLVEVGLLPYRPGPWSVQEWDDRYVSGALDYLGSRSELGRYSVLVGYLASLDGPRHVLDIGCGTGLLFERARHLPFRRWTGVDLSAAAVTAAAVTADARAEFIVDDVMSPRWQPDPIGYDCILVNEVLNMCEAPAAFLARVRGLLQSDGTLLVSAWRHRGDRQLWKLVHHLFREVDSIDLRSSTSTLAPRGWRVALLEAR